MSLLNNSIFIYIKLFYNSIQESVISFTCDILKQTPRLTGKPKLKDTKK